MAQHEVLLVFLMVLLDENRSLIGRCDSGRSTTNIAVRSTKTRNPHQDAGSLLGRAATDYDVTGSSCSSRTRIEIGLNRNAGFSITCQLAVPTRMASGADNANNVTGDSPGKYQSSSF